MALSDRLEHLGKKLQERRLELNPRLNKKTLKKEDTSKRITAKDEVGPNFREPSRASRTDFSDESIGPNMSGRKRMGYIPDDPKKIAKAAGENAKKTVADAKKEAMVTGNIGARSMLGEGEVNPFAARAAAPVEAPIQYPSRTADVVPEEEIAAAASSAAEPRMSTSNPMGMKKGGSVKAKAKTKCMSSGGSTSSRASSRGDGCAQRGKTRGRMV